MAELSLKTYAVCPETGAATKSLFTPILPVKINTMKKDLEWCIVMVNSAKKYGTILVHFYRTPGHEIHILTRILLKLQKNTIQWFYQKYWNLTKLWAKNHEFSSLVVTGYAHMSLHNSSKRLFFHNS